MRKLFVLFFFTTLVYQGFGQANDSISLELTRALEEIYSGKNINGISMTIINQDGVLFKKGLGYADRKANKKYTENTIQPIASISKTFIGIALLKAEELGYLNLEDPINKHLPFEVVNPKYPNSPITILQLATHTSSIKDPKQYEENGYVLKEKDNETATVNKNFRSPNEMMTLHDFLKNILCKDGHWYKKKNFSKKEPGTEYVYSNIGAGIAALVIENACGESYNSFSKKHILSPLNMDNSGWFHHEVDFSMHSKLYKKVGTELAFYQLINYPDGGLMTSSNDIGKYLIELINGYNGNGTILTNKSYKKLFKPYLPNKTFKDSDDNITPNTNNQGLFMELASPNSVGHTGGDPGVITAMFFNPQTGIGKFLMVNTENTNDKIATEYFEIWAILKEYQNKFTSSAK